MRPVTTALLLDVDDTLIDTKAAMVAAGAVAVARLWPEAGDDVHHTLPAFIFTVTRAASSGGSPLASWALFR